MSGKAQGSTISWDEATDILLHHGHSPAAIDRLIQQASYLQIRGSAVAEDAALSTVRETFKMAGIAIKNIDFT